MARSVKKTTRGKSVPTPRARSTAERTRPGARLQVEERRRRLIELGRKLFSEHAYDDLSTDELARRAGVSAGLLYHYFESKRGFYIATMRNVAEEVRDRTAPVDGLEFNETLHRSLTAFVDFVGRNDRLYRALVRGGIGSDREVESILEDLRQINATRIVEKLGVRKPSHRLLCTVYGWIGFVEFACLWWADHRGVSREQLIQILQSAALPIVEQAE